MWLPRNGLVNFYKGSKDINMLIFTYNVIDYGSSKVNMQPNKCYVHLAPLSRTHTVYSIIHVVYVYILLYKYLFVT